MPAFSSKQPLEITLRSFLEMGNVGPLCVGAGVQDISFWLGEPAYRTEPYPKGGRNKHSVVAFRYGCLEIGFVNETVEYLGFEIRDGALPAILVVVGYFPLPQTTWGTLRTYLESGGIPYKVSGPLTFPGQLAIRMGDGATAVFSEDDQTLVSIFFSKKETW